MNEIIIYHNPRCSKSRETLTLLRNKGINPKVIPYLETPPTAGELDRILTVMKMEPRALMRKKEEAYQALEIEETPRTRRELIQLMIDNPILIERPIVVNGERAALGRPPEEVLKIL